MWRNQLRRYAGLLTAWIPDLSGLSKRDRTLVGVGVSLFVHLALFLILIICSVIIPKPDIQPPPAPRTIELTIVEPPPPPDKEVLPLAPQPQFLDTTGLEPSKTAPVNPDFQSSQNGVAASEMPAKGDNPLPAQEGKDLPALAFKNQRAISGKSAETEPDESTKQPPTPPVEASPPAPDVPLRPRLDISKVARVQTAATPAALASPPPRSLDKTDTPALAQATPPPLKTVDKVKEDEVAVSKKPPATPPPSLAETETPEPKSALIPPPATPLPIPTPRIDTRQAMLVTPSPKSRQPTKPSSQLEQQQNRIEGSISNRGRRSVNSISTPLGKYRKQVMDAIGSRWQRYVKDHADVLSLGSARVTFYIDTTGKVRGLRVDDNTSNQSFADICERAIREAESESEIPAPSEDAIAPIRDGHVEFSINFLYYSL